MSGPITPYAGTSAARLTAMMNSDNAGQSNGSQVYTALQLGVDFTFGDPQAYTDSDGRNTEAPVIVNRPDYQNTDMVQFTRLPLTVLNQLPPSYVDPVLISKVPFKLSDILPAINDALGLDLDVSEIRDQEYDTLQPQYLLPIDSTKSLAWIDSDFQFNAKVSLVGLITTTTLNGLYFLKPPVSNLLVFAADFTKAPEQIMVDMVNFYNPVNGQAALKTTDVVFAAPVATNAAGPMPNTAVIMSGSATGLGSGSVMLNYNRWEIGTVPVILGVDAVFTITTEKTVKDLIPQLNAHFGINLTPADYVDAPLPTFTGSVQNEFHDTTIQMAATSLIWQGSINVRVQVASVAPPVGN